MSDESPPKHRNFDADLAAIWVLRLGVFGCFLGWAWQHLVWSAPYDAVLWNPDYAGRFATWLNLGWENYIAEFATDTRILITVRIVGFVYLLIAAASLVAKRSSLGSQSLLVLGSLMLACLFFCKYVESGYAIATFVEHGGQILAPISLLTALRRGIGDRWTILISVVGFWATFGGHGFYAIGFAPTPGNFYGLVHAITGLDADISELFLKTAGVLDFAVCVGVLVPFLRRVSLAYAATWGALTALARPIAGMSVDAEWCGADEFLHEAILRAPHVALPLFLLIIFSRKDNEIETRP